VFHSVLQPRRFLLRLNQWRQLSALVLLSGVLAACADAESRRENDPLEPMNRTVFDANDAVDKAVALPIAKAYVEVVPEFARTGVHNFLENLDLPVTFANDVLQGELDRAAHTFARLTINTTIGIGGLIDVASDADLQEHTEDFGETLAVYGVDEGPYLVLPLFGPSNPRDTAGMVVDVFLDPLTYAKYHNKWLWANLRIAGEFLDARSRNIDALDTIERGSIDYYAAMRSLYRQHRENEIRNGRPSSEPLPDF
jgi:phospholipid-binding lipoprotein MlaA